LGTITKKNKGKKSRITDLSQKIKTHRGLRGGHVKKPELFHGKKPRARRPDFPQPLKVRTTREKHL